MSELEARLLAQYEIYRWLLDEAGKRFDVFSGKDQRGAAFWDAAVAIDEQWLKGWRP